MATDSGNKENDPREREADLTADRDRVPVKKELKVTPVIIIEGAPITKSSDPFLDVTDSYNPSSNGSAPLGKRKGGSQEESAKRLRVESGQILNSNSAPTTDVVVSICGLSVWNDTDAASKGKYMFSFFFSSYKRINDTTSSSSTTSSTTSSTSTSSTSLSVCDGHTNAVSQLIAGNFDGLSIQPHSPIQNQNNPTITSSVHTMAVSMATTICAPVKSHTIWMPRAKLMLPRQHMSPRQLMLPRQHMPPMQLMLPRQLTLHPTQPLNVLCLGRGSGCEMEWGLNRME